METIYEDGDILVLNKPPGLVIDREHKPRVLENCLVVHRLDKDTSGLLVMAKTPEALESLKKQFKERKVKKGYWALVHGRFTHPKGVIEAPVGRNPKDTKKFAVRLADQPPRSAWRWRRAVTKYRVRKLEAGRLKLERKLETGGWKNRASSFEPQFKHQASSFQHPHTGEVATLLELEPLTGRTHQIRVHLKSIGHPIVGDKLYASRRQIREDEKICPRQFLHAYRLGFEHPRTGEWLSFETDLPEDLREVLGRISNS